MPRINLNRDGLSTTTKEEHSTKRLLLELLDQRFSISRTTLMLIHKLVLRNFLRRRHARKRKRLPKLKKRKRKKMILKPMKKKKRLKLKKKIKTPKRQLFRPLK